MFGLIRSWFIPKLNVHAELVELSKSLRELAVSMRDESKDKWRNIEQHFDLAEELREFKEETKDQYNNAYARTAERNLANAHGLIEHQRHVEKELLARWRIQVADLQELLARERKRYEQEIADLKLELKAATWFSSNAPGTPVPDLIDEAMSGGTRSDVESPGEQLKSLSGFEELERKAARWDWCVKYGLEAYRLLDQYLDRDDFDLAAEVDKQIALSATPSGEKKPTP